MEQFFERTFKLREHGTTVRTEVMAGTITFLAMVYILAVNPSILAASGMEPGAVFTATAISAAFGTLFMAFYANYPIALASGMGLNAYFAYSVCVPMAEQGIQDPWTIALTAVLVEGIIFILLTLCKFREALVNDVPENLKMGIAAGIGLFIALVGLANAGVVVDNPSTLIDLGSFATPQVALSIIGLVAVAVMYSYRVPGYILWGILGTWLLGIVAQLIGWYEVDPAGLIGAMLVSLGLLLALLVWYVFWLRARIPDVGVSFFGAAYTGLLLCGLIVIRVSLPEPWGGIVVLLLFLSVWANDAFAYLVGSKIGRHKLAPRTSPKKSWEGFFAGLVGSVLFW